VYLSERWWIKPFLELLDLRSGARKLLDRPTGCRVGVRFFGEKTSCCLLAVVCWQAGVSMEFNAC